MDHADTTTLRAQNESLRQENDHLRVLEREYERVLAELKQKEAFNFALFQFSPIATVVVDREGKVIRSNMARRSAGDRLPSIGAVMYRDFAAHHTIDMHAELMGCLSDNAPRRFPRMSYGRRTLAITIAPFPLGAIIISQDISEQVKAEKDRINLIDDLRRALDEVETLRGLLPICAACKKIRDDKGYWNTVEEYFSRRVKIDFSHTMCPDCIKSMYPDMWEIMQKQSAHEPHAG